MKDPSDAVFEALLQTCKDWQAEAIGRIPAKHDGGVALYSVVPKGRVNMARILFSRRSDGVHLRFGSEDDMGPFGGGSGFGIVMKDGFDAAAALSVTAACAAAFSFPAELLASCLRTPQLTTDGRPTRRSCKYLQEALLKTLSKERVGLSSRDPELYAAPWTMKRDGSLRHVPGFVADAVMKLHKIWMGFTGEDVRRELESCRDSFKLLVRHATWEQVRQVWDEEVVRSVQES